MGRTSSKQNSAREKDNVNANLLHFWLTYNIRYFYHVYFVMNLKFYRQAILIKALIFS